MTQDEPSHCEDLKRHSDAEFVRLLVAGSQDAMGAFFRLLLPHGDGVALRIVGDTAASEDVVEVVFTDFYRQALRSGNAVCAYGFCNMPSSNP